MAIRIVYDFNAPTVIKHSIFYQIHLNLLI